MKTRALLRISAFSLISGFSMQIVVSSIPKMVASGDDWIDP
jgi:hypothetical protein